MKKKSLLSAKFKVKHSLTVGETEIKDSLLKGRILMNH